MEQNDFPWAYPEIFTNILIQTDFKTILNARLACKSWNDWFNKNKVWIKYLKRIRHLSPLNDEGFDIDIEETIDEYEENTNTEKSIKITEYRLNTMNRLLKGSGLYSEAEALAISCKICKIHRQEELNLVPNVDKKVYGNIIKCKKLLHNQEHGGIRSFGPVSAFIRLKVESELITSIITTLMNKRNYLSIIVLDKNFAQAITSHFDMMTGQSYVKEYFKTEDNTNSHVLNEGPEAEVYTSEAEMLAAEAAKAASKALAAANGLKRGAESISDEPTSKKVKTTSSEIEEEKEENIYSSAKPTPVHPYYPTILELLDIDNPVLEKVLKRDLGIHKILVIPRLDQILIQQSKTDETHLIPKDFEAIGSDCDGLVMKLKPSVDVTITDEATVYENENVGRTNDDVDETGQIMFWGGFDIRNRWSKFADQLSQPETQKVKKAGTKSKGLPSLDKNIAADSLPESLPGLQAMLAARGVSLQL